MASKILFVFEGERTEIQIKKSLLECFFSENNIVHTAFCAEIYQLYSKLKQDEYLDTYELLKEIPENYEKLKEFERDDFSEIYLFFDFDGHSTLAADEKLKELLEIFDEETDEGKLYVSYPMVEALKHISSKIDFRSLKIDARNNIRYKDLVNKVSDPCYQALQRLSTEDWLYLAAMHLKKANFIVNGDFSLPDYYIDQDEILQGQRERYLEVDETIAVLSGFPLFLHYYFGASLLLRLNKKSEA